MRREFFIHFSFWLFFFVFVALARHYFSFNFWPFWVGGVVGLFLPDLDHLIYVLFVNPQELTSQRVGYLFNHKELRRVISLLYETRGERKGLIFHTIFFQVIFLILTFWMLSSSNSIFGVGLTLSFALHLSVDQLVDLVEIKSLGNWFKYLPFSLDVKSSKIYWMASFVLVCIMGFLM